MVVGSSVRIKKYSVEFFLDDFSLVRECILECRRLNAKEVCYKSKGICISHDSSVDIAGMVDCEFEIAEMEDGHNELMCLGNMSLGETNGFESDFKLLKLVGVIVSDAVWAGTSIALAKVSVMPFSCK